MRHFSNLVSLVGLIIVGLWLSTANGFTQNDDAKYAARDAANLKESKDIKTQPIPGVAGFDWDYNQIIFYGQSLSNGTASRFALSTDPLPGNFMIGNAVAYQLDSPKQFSPMIAVVTGRDPEEPIIATVNSLRKYLGGTATPALIASSCGTGGKALEQLVKGGGNNWTRLTGAISVAHDLAKAQGKTCGVSAFCYVQGEANYNPTGNFTSEKDPYKALLAKLRQDFLAECVPGQKPPVMFTYQTGGSYASDVNHLSIGMAQWELSRKIPRSSWLRPSILFRTTAAILRPMVIAGWVPSSPKS